MKKFECIVRIVKDSKEYQPLGTAIIEASRTAVAVKKAAECLPNTPPKGTWMHVSLRRIS